jgi:hypothetical protein
MNFGTHGGAAAAIDTLIAGKGEVLPVVDTLGIVAPEAAQGAAFKKYRSPDAGTIVYTEVLYVENSAANLHVIRGCRLVLFRHDKASPQR